jgi:hypothetical protein
MALSTWAGNAVLDALLNNVALQVAQSWASLHSGDPGLTGTNELSGNGYGRKAVTAGAPVAHSGATDNTGAVTFGPATGSNWAQATYGGLFDAETVGNFMGGAALTDARTVNAGQYAEYAIGALDFSIGTQFGEDIIDAIVNALLRNTELVYAQAYMSLHSGDPGATGANELSGNNYSRTAASFGAANAKSCSNDAVVNTAIASGDWAQATYLGLWSAATDGTFLWKDSLTAPVTVQSGKRFRAAVGEIVVSIA